MAGAAIEVDRVTHRYGDRVALDALTLAIDEHELFAFLGPNGGGKTTLFRLLSTLIPPRQGSISILGGDVVRDIALVRASIGVVFQAPSLDRKLTVGENLWHQGKLYGLGGAELRARMAEVLDRLGLADRAKHLVETLSGGLRRRVELAKSLLHRPRVLLMDEPSTGLDPGARSDLWRYLRELRETEGVTVALTTHLLEEAERADRIAILNHGKLVALDAPERLKAELGGDAITIATEDAPSLAAAIGRRFDCAAHVVDGAVRVERSEGHALLGPLCEAFPAEIQSITLGKPTLEDVFIARTGHRFWQNAEERADA
jgi:ABC-2 type transport system ATP-binding protein